jgi:hypothetical protein
MPLRGLLLGALGGRNLAGAGFRCRSLSLLLGAELLQELMANLGLQRSHVFADLRVGAG